MANRDVVKVYVRRDRVGKDSLASGRGQRVTVCFDCVRECACIWGPTAFPVIKDVFQCARTYVFLSVETEWRFFVLPSCPA